MNGEIDIKNKMSKEEPIISTEVPWSVLGADLSDYDGKMH